MSIVKPIQKEKTREDVLQEKVEQIVNLNVEVYNFLVNAVQRGFNMVQNPNQTIMFDMGMTPEHTFTTQEILDALEANGYSTLKYFQTSGLLQDFLLFVSENEYQRLIPKPFEVVDGKIISPEPVVEEPIINPEIIN